MLVGSNFNKKNIYSQSRMHQFSTHSENETRLSSVSNYLLSSLNTTITLFYVWKSFWEEDIFNIFLLTTRISLPVQLRDAENVVWTVWTSDYCCMRKSSFAFLACAVWYYMWSDTMFLPLYSNTRKPLRSVWLSPVSATLQRQPILRQPMMQALSSRAAHRKQRSLGEERHICICTSCGNEL